MTDADARPQDAADATEQQVLFFRDGIPGFPEARRFLLVDLEEGSVFQLLQSVDNPDLSMVVTVPWVFFPDYAPEIPTADERDLGLERPEDAVVFCAVTVDEDGGEELYVNLLGPFVVNISTKEGRQVVLQDPSLPVRAGVPLSA